MKNKYGFIYKIGGDYALRMGNSLYFLEDGIQDIETDIEIGNIDEDKLVNGYGLRIDKRHKKWKIIDTGHKNCKDILAEGKYKEGFEQSLEKFLRIFK
jgi:hypothetical protein